jgi:surface polysaccharide O-acyltransferase-like enzyme
VALLIPGESRGTSRARGRPAVTLPRRAALPEPATPLRPGSRDTAIDLLKILAIFGVLCIHACGLYAYDGRVPNPEEIRYGFLFIAFFTFCIPIFVMCSGAMLLSGTRDAPPIAFYRRRLSRILLPLLVWSVVYFMYTAPTWPTLTDIPRLGSKLLANKVFGILWYLYMLLGVYLSAPFLQMIRRQASRSQLWLLVGICLILDSLQRLLPHVQKLDFGLDYSIFTPYIGYFVLGYLLQTTKPLPGRYRLGWLGLYVLLSLGAFWAQWMIQTHCSEVPYNFLDFSSINVAIGATALFLVLHGLPLSLPPALTRAIGWLANATYGIYLVHMVAQDLLARGVFGFRLVPGTFAPVIDIPLTAAGMFVVSLAMVGLLSRIPYLRRTVGYGGRTTGRPAR